MMSNTIGSIRAWMLGLCLCLAMVAAASGDTKADETTILERIDKACAAFEQGDANYLVDFLWSQATHRHWRSSPRHS